MINNCNTSNSDIFPKVDVVLGAQWGDEGKGKLVDLLSINYDICCRCQGGDNAGHTIVHKNITYKFHLCPSGLINDKVTGFIGSGCVLNLFSLYNEIVQLNELNVSNLMNRIKISNRVHLIFEKHIKLDFKKEQEKTNKIGTTNKGIGPCYADKMDRSNLRLCDLMYNIDNKQKLTSLLKPFINLSNGTNDNNDAKINEIIDIIDKIKPMVVDGISYLHSQLSKENKKILVEGANALMLDIDYGTYPFVTSSNCSIGGAITGLGISPKYINEVFGVIKAYCTRVGEGPFPTELAISSNECQYLQSKGHEIGTTTGRIRRCGWLDLFALKYSCIINNYSCLNLTKLDVLDNLAEIKVGIAYRNISGSTLDYFPASSEELSQIEVEYKIFKGWKEPISNIKQYNDLPQNAKIYIEYIQSYLNIPIKYIGVGSSRDQMIII